MTEISPMYKPADSLELQVGDVYRQSNARFLVAATIPTSAPAPIIQVFSIERNPQKFDVFGHELADSGYERLPFLFPEYLRRVPATKSAESIDALFLYHHMDTLLANKAQSGPNPTGYQHGVMSWVTEVKTGAIHPDTLLCNIAFRLNTDGGVGVALDNLNRTELGKVYSDRTLSSALESAGARLDDSGVIAAIGIRGQAVKEYSFRDVAKARERPSEVLKALLYGPKDSPFKTFSTSSVGIGPRPRAVVVETK